MRPGRSIHDGYIYLDQWRYAPAGDDLCAVIAPYYPKGENGRPPVGLERMLRITFLQQWFNLSDPGAEEVLYEPVSMCRFVGIDLG